MHRTAMARVAGFFTAAFLIMAPVFAIASTWNIDPEHTNVGFKVRHLMVSNVKGGFGKVSGVVNVDEKDITKSSTTVTIDTTSIDTGVAKRDAHLKSPDFLDVVRYPTMTFVSTGVMKGTGGAFKLAGNLTLHGVTRPVVLQVEGLSGEIKDPMGNIRRGASATTTINRKDYGLVWNKMLEAGGVAVGDEVVINIEVEMVKAK